MRIRSPRVPTRRLGRVAVVVSLVGSCVLAATPAQAHPGDGSGGRPWNPGRSWSAGSGSSGGDSPHGQSGPVAGGAASGDGGATSGAGGAAASSSPCGQGATRSGDGSCPAAQRQVTTGVYVYRKADASKPASWRNSTQQYLVKTVPGARRAALTLAEVQAVVPDVCGDGWGVQADQAYGGPDVFTTRPAPAYPHDTLGRPPVFHAEHRELADLVEVPACGAPADQAADAQVAVEAAPMCPIETPSPTPGTTTTPAPTPSASPTSAPTATTSPAPTESPAAVTPTPTAAARSDEHVVTAVLAAEEEHGAVLASTGASAGGTAAAAGALLLAGAALVAVRRRRLRG